MNNNGGTFSGQSYGYIIYRIKASLSESTSYWAGPVQNFAILIVDGVIQEIIDDRAVHPEYWIDSQRGTQLEPKNGEEQTIDLLIENSGRHNVGGENEFKQQKGLPKAYGGYISLNGVDQTTIETFALEFRSNWVKNLTNWKNMDATSLKAPCLVQSTFEISGPPTDTYLDMTSWHKGIVFVNSFNVGRYFKVGPSKTLYVPAPLLQTGPNIITIFEQINPGNSITFRNSLKDDENVPETTTNVPGTTTNVPGTTTNVPGATASHHSYSNVFIFSVFCFVLINYF